MPKVRHGGVYLQIGQSPQTAPLTLRPYIVRQKTKRSFSQNFLFLVLVGVGG
ncbi:MAG: hypothetical protein GIW99_07255 [Candidatus Eremiobacteraeota bacterium]|nr:hypothetical protein [Candidatus Eremiobacteraeota bacterium]